MWPQKERTSDAGILLPFPRRIIGATAILNGHLEYVQFEVQDPSVLRVAMEDRLGKKLPDILPDDVTESVLRATYEARTQGGIAIMNYVAKDGNLCEGLVSVPSRDMILLTAINKIR